MKDSAETIVGPWFTRPEAAEYCKTTTGTLAQLAYAGGGPRYYKPTKRKVLYKKSDLDAWLSANVFTSTMENA